MLENLIRIIEYCQTINVGLSVPEPHIVADENQGTTVLNSPSIEGPQIIISMPLAKLSGNCDGITGPHTFILYTLEKAKEMTATKCNVVGQYQHAEKSARKIFRGYRRPGIARRVSPPD